MIFKILGGLVLLIGLYFLYLGINPTGTGASSMNIVAGIIFALIGILLLVKKKK